MTTHAKKIVLLAESGDILDRDRLLRELFDDRIELFCATGRDAQEWEDCMDWIVVMAAVDDGIEHSVLTTSHHEATIDEVVALAKQISVPSGANEVEIIRV